MASIGIDEIKAIVLELKEDIERQAREDAYREFAEVVALDIADCSKCPIDCEMTTYGNCEKSLIEYVKEQK